MILGPGRHRGSLQRGRLYEAYAGRPGGFVREAAAVWEYLLQAAAEPVGLRLHAEPGEARQWIGALPDLRPTDERCAQSTMTLFTSGTTGVPKAATHTLHEVLARKRGGTSSERWLLAYAPQRWAGVSVLLHALRFGAAVIVPASLDPVDVVRAGIAAGATHVSMTPSYLRRLQLCRAGGELSRLPLLQVTFGGETASSCILEAAKRLWPCARITHVYALTEFGDVCSVSDGAAGIPTSKFDRPGLALAAGGELVIHGRPTGDLWERRGDRYFFLGRKQEVINVGGAKVFPLTVEAAALALDGVEDARAFGIPNALLGQVVALDYRGRRSEAEVQRLLRTQLPKVAWPARVQRVDVLALTDANKVRRLGMP
jgi:acyl-CoA synthetase (AMP-forming)/AMP-acid ligase II